jgi:endoglucanase
VGVRGAQTAPHLGKPDAAIVLEGTPADDFPGIPEEEQQGALGRGVQIRLMDPSAIMNRKFVDLALDLAKQHQIPHQVAVRKSGGTDARAIHLHGSGIPTLVLGVPARYIHTHNSIFNIQDYFSALDLTRHLILAMDSGAVEGFTAF